MEFRSVLFRSAHPNVPGETGEASAARPTGGEGECRRSWQRLLESGGQAIDVGLGVHFAEAVEGALAELGKLAAEGLAAKNSPGSEALMDLSHRLARGV